MAEIFDPAEFPRGRATHPNGCDCLTVIRGMATEFNQGQRTHPEGCDCLAEILATAGTRAAQSRGRGRAPGRRNYFDDPRFSGDLDLDPYADVLPIPFFPADLPRLTADPFGWTREELSSALAYAQKKEPIMYVEASKLRLINIGQLIEVASGGTLTMGKLERVKRNETGKVTLRISGDSVCVPENHQVNIRRSPELYELHLASLGVEDLVDAGIGVGAQ